MKISYVSLYVFRYLKRFELIYCVIRALSQFFRCVI